MRGLGVQFVLLAAALAGIPGFAAERVTLTNGFEIACTHHALVDGKYRIYTSRDGGSFIEFAPDRIAGIETVPDPPAAPDQNPESPANRTPSKPATESRLTPEDLHQMLASAGTAHNVDADLLASVVKAESAGNAHAVSRAGAEGLMQLMPTTAADLGVQDSFRPEENVRGGSAYLDSLLARYHDNLAVALAAYNAGPAAVDRYHGIPPYHETQAYVARVIHEFNRRVRERERLAQQASTR